MIILVTYFKEIYIYLFLFLNISLHIRPSDLHPLLNDALKLKNIKGQINCKNEEFQCGNGKCIPGKFNCDGIVDCSDGSDETYDNCQNITCDSQYFQCNYGACINKEYQCDGLVQCFDKSDEICNTTRNQSNRITRDVKPEDRSCPVPYPTDDRSVTFQCDGSGSCDAESGYVSQSTVAIIKCTSNYFQGKDKETHSESICLNKNWQPEIPNCFKFCRRLNPMNVDLQCIRNGMEFPCDEHTVLLAGTKVRPKCKSLHKYIQPPNYLEIACDEDGIWDNPLFSCIPECGKTFSNPIPLIADGVEEKFGDSPWHVAIYNKAKNLICGGTIISLHLVVSAAHCFTKSGDHSKELAKDYEVAVSKFSRNYFAEDNQNQKIIKIKEIRFSNKGFVGLGDNFAGDIAILILKETLPISKSVLPACLDWIGLKDGKYPSENALGKVVGWGKNENGRYSENLTTTNLPYISRERCIQTVPTDFQPFVTFDKFCAGSDNGPTVLQGDSGGGLLFKMNEFYYLRGIVSVKQPTKSSLAAFTDLSAHIQWISDIRYEVENAIIKMTNLIQQINYEMQTKYRDDPLKLLQFSERLKKDIIDRETFIDDLKSEAKSLIDVLINSMVKIISDALVTNNLPKIHQISVPLLSKRDYDTYFKIFDKSVNHVLDKMSVDELLAAVSQDNEVCCIEELISMYVVIFYRMQRSGGINTVAQAKLADRVSRTIALQKYKTTDPKLKSMLDQIKDKLPATPTIPNNSDFPVKIPPKPTIKNITSIPPNKFPEKPTIKNDTNFPSKICIKSIAHEEYLIVFDPSTKGQRKSNVWQFEPDGDYVYIKQKQSQKYVYANFQEKYKNTGRTALTLKLGNRTLNSKWKIIDCPAELESKAF